MKLHPLCCNVAGAHNRLEWPLKRVPDKPRNESPLKLHELAPVQVDDEDETTQALGEARDAEFELGETEVEVRGAVL